VSYKSPVIVEGRRVWRILHEIDASEGALPYERVLGGEDYIEHLARAALAAGAGRSGMVGRRRHTCSTREGW
jgi:aminoglycoside 3-N-acetyltransferase